MTDSTGNTVWKASYTPFGKVSIEIDLISQRARFPGQYADAESGLYYNYFRDYDPEIGRYIQSDPIGLMGGINTYAYVSGNPVNLYDPYGLWAVGDPIPTNVTNIITGFGDAFGAGILRDAMNIDGGIDKCSLSYISSNIVGGLWGPIGRLSYITKISKIPQRAASLGGSSWKQARRAYKYRKGLKAYFRGPMPWKKWLERRDPSWDFLNSKNKGNFQRILERSGGHNKTWNIPLLYAPAAITGVRTTSSLSGCGCE